MDRRLHFVWLAICMGCASFCGEPQSGLDAPLARLGAGQSAAAQAHPPAPAAQAKNPGTSHGRRAPQAAPRTARGGAPYDVGRLPAELTLRWPAAPHTARALEVGSGAELERAAAQGAIRVVVARALSGTVTLRGSDVEVAMRPGARIERIVIGPGSKRVALRGGRYGQIALARPAQFSPHEMPRPEWLVEDVLVDGVEIDSPAIGVELYGQRVAVLRSAITAGTYSIYSTSVLGVGSEDVVIAGNRLSSAGPEATLRLTDVLRSVTVDNVLRNTFKHNYRVHGRSDLSYAARNVLIDTGAMIGAMPNDHLGRVWFERNTFYHTAPDLFNPGETRIDALHVRDNVAYTNVRRCFVCSRALPRAWLDKGNRILPYRRAPEYSSPPPRAAARPERRAHSR